MNRPTLIVLDDDAWGERALDRIIRLRECHESLVVATFPEQRLLQNCDLWSEHSWLEPNDGWGVSIIGDTAQEFAMIDASEFRREVSDSVWRASDAAVVTTAVGASPRTLLSGPRYAQYALDSGLTDLVLYLCSHKKWTARRNALGRAGVDYFPTEAIPLKPAA